MEDARGSRRMMDMNLAPIGYPLENGEIIGWPHRPSDGPTLTIPLASRQSSRIL